MRRFVPATPADPQPIAGINTTPLIDVMLVLLIMFVLTVPPMTHKVPLDLPQPGGAPSTPPVTHLLSIARDGAMTLDGATVDEAGLQARLLAIAADPAAVLTLQTDAQTRYERFDATLAVIKRAGVNRLGFVGNDRMVW
jgi:biopolymer transport protein ExbD